MEYFFYEFHGNGTEKFPDNVHYYFHVQCDPTDIKHVKTLMSYYIKKHIELYSWVTEKYNFICTKIRPFSDKIDSFKKFDDVPFERMNYDEPYNTYYGRKMEGYPLVLFKIHKEGSGGNLYFSQDEIKITADIDIYIENERNKFIHQNEVSTNKT